MTAPIFCFTGGALRCRSPAMRDGQHRSPRARGRPGLSRPAGLGKTPAEPPSTSTAGRRPSPIRRRRPPLPRRGRRGSASASARRKRRHQSLAGRDNRHRRRRHLGFQCLKPMVISAILSSISAVARTGRFVISAGDGRHGPGRCPRTQAGRETAAVPMAFMPSSSTPSISGVSQNRHSLAVQGSCHLCRSTPSRRITRRGTAASSSPPPVPA